MDAHYDQVTRRRAELASSAPRHYFAYSTILDRAALEEWRTQHGYNDFELPNGQLAEALDVDLIYDFPSRWWGGLVAGLTDKPGSRVCGVLYTILGRDWPIIEHKEGAITGMAVTRTVRVLVDGTELDAIAFTTNPARATTEGSISVRFVEALRRGAQSAGLPAAWLDRLRG